MIRNGLKHKLLNEIQKLGIVSLACQRVGVDKATYYRWKEKDEDFKKKAEEAEKIGRENFCDMSESYLAKNIKAGVQRAIEFFLVHNSPIYKPSHTSNVIFVHKKDNPIPLIRQKTLEDIITEDEILYNKTLEIQEKYQNVGGIPPKPDGSPIAEDELPKYEGYIEEWYKKKELDSRKKAENKTPD